MGGRWNEALRAGFPHFDLVRNDRPMPGNFLAHGAFLEGSTQGERVPMENGARTAARSGNGPALASALEDVLRRCAEPDAGGRDELAAACGPQLRATLARTLGSDELAGFALPAVLADLYDRAGEFDPGRQSAQDWVHGCARARIRELALAADGAGRPHASAPPPAASHALRPTPRRRRKRRGRRMLVWASAGAALTAATAAALVLAPSPRVEAPDKVATPAAAAVDPGPPPELSRTGRLDAAASLSAPPSAEPVATTRLTRPAEPPPPPAPPAEPDLPAAEAPPPSPPAAEALPPSPPAAQAPPVAAPPLPAAAVATAPRAVRRPLPRPAAAPSPPGEPTVTLTRNAPEPATPAPSGARVFLHHTAGSAPDAAAARALAEALREQGFEVAAIRKVPFEIRRGSVRYYFDRDAAVARELAAMCNARLAEDPGCARGPVDFGHFSPRPAPGTLEIWISSR